MAPSHPCKPVMPAPFPSPHNQSHFFMPDLPCQRSARQTPMPLPLPLCPDRYCIQAPPHDYHLHTSKCSGGGTRNFLCEKRDFTRFSMRSMMSCAHVTPITPACAAQARAPTVNASLTAWCESTGNADAAHPPARCGAHDVHTCKIDPAEAALRATAHIPIPPRLRSAEAHDAAFRLSQSMGLLLHAAQLLHAAHVACVACSPCGLRCMQPMWLALHAVHVACVACSPCGLRCMQSMWLTLYASSFSQRPVFCTVACSSHMSEAI